MSRLIRIISPGIWRFDLGRGRRPLRGRFRELTIFAQPASHNPNQTSKSKRAKRRRRGKRRALRMMKEAVQ